MSPFAVWGVNELQKESNTHSLVLKADSEGTVEIGIL